MVWPGKLKIVFKAISACVAGIFLLQQIAWAGDFVESVLEKQYREQAQTFAPAYLQGQQAAMEQLISQKQIIEDLSSAQNQTLTQSPKSEPATINLIGPRGGGQDGSASSAVQSLPIYNEAQEGSVPPVDSAILSITTSSGDIIHYRNDGSIDHIEKKDQATGSMIIISRVGDLDLVDGSNNLSNAEITYPDGTILICENGKIKSVAKPDLTTYIYHIEGAYVGLVKQAVYMDADGNITNTVDYSYTLIDGEVSESVLTDSNKTCYYDENNKLKRVKYTDSKREILYIDGILAQAIDADGTTYTYETTQDVVDGELQYTVYLKTISLTSIDGIYYEYDPQGRPLKVSDTNGYYKNFEYFGDTGRMSAFRQYDSANNLLASCTFLNEDFNFQGYGRIDRAINMTPDAEGAVAYQYTYLVPVLNSKLVNSDETLSDGTYTYSALRIESGCVLTITGNVTLKVVRGNLDIRGTLRVAKGATLSISELPAGRSLTIGAGGTTVLSSGLSAGTGQGGTPMPQSNPPQASSLDPLPPGDHGLVVDGLMRVEGNYPVSTASERRDYSDTSFSSDKLVATYIYDSNGQLWKKIVNDGNVYSYYAKSQRIKSVLLYAPDSSEESYYQFIDEDFNFQGYGRIDEAVRFTTDATGALAYRYTYYNPRLDSKLISQNTTWKSGTYTYSALRIEEGCTLTITGNVTLSVVRGNLDIKGTLRVAQGATLSISELPAGRSLTIGAGGTTVLSSGLSAGTGQGSTSAPQSNPPQASSLDPLPPGDHGLVVEGTMYVGAPAPVTGVSHTTTYSDVYFEHVAGSYSHSLPGITIPDVLANNKTSVVAIHNPLFDLPPSRDVDNTKPYFNTLRYGVDGVIKSVTSPDGRTIESQTTNEYLLLNITGLDDVTYKFKLSDLGNIQEIIAQKANLTMTYDPMTGELLTIQSGDTVFSLDDDYEGAAFLLNGSILTAPDFDSETGGITDGTFERHDSSGNVIGIATYEGGMLTHYVDASGNEYKYDINGNLTDLKKKTSTGEFVTYTYTSSQITIAQVSEDQIESLNATDPIIIKYENTGTGKRIVYLETKDGHYKNFEYKEGCIIVTEGIIRIVDSQKVFVKESVETYDSSLRLLSSEGKDGVINQYEYMDNTNTLLRITVIKNDFSYIFENNILTRSVSKDGLETTYYSNGLVKTIETSPGVIKEYKYGVSNNFLFNTETFLSRGALNGIAYDVKPDDVIEMRLDREHIDYGDGRDGALNVLAGQTYEIVGPKQYSSINIETGAVVTVAPWDGSNGGEIEIKCNGTVAINGILQADAKGYRGGSGSIAWNEVFIYGFQSMQGESYTGSPSISISNNYGAGGGAIYKVYLDEYHRPHFLGGVGAGGGGYGTHGGSGLPPGSSAYGDIYGDQYLTDFYRGSGGGAGWYGATGGNGGGSIKIIGQEINISGNVSSNGGNGSNASGGGSGGSIWVIGEDINIEGSVTAYGGQGSANSYMAGGQGGDGRIRIDYVNLNITGTIGSAAYQKQYDYSQEGTFESEIIETNTPYFQNISWNETLPTGTDAVVETRSGNTSTPDPSWSAWSAPLTDSSGSKMQSSGGKYVQFRVKLTTSDKTATPKLTFTPTTGINIGYVSMQDDGVDASRIALVETIQGEHINYYTPDGQNIHNPADSINVPTLISVMSLVNGMIDNANSYLEEGLNLNPGSGLLFNEESGTIWAANASSQDISKFTDADVLSLIYETITSGDTEEKRITSLTKKNGDERYWSYGDSSGTVDDIKDEDGQTYSYKVSTYGSSGVITQAKLLYDDETKNQVIQYENGKIKTVMQNNAEILQYTYETLEGGRDATVINDISDTNNPVKKYYIDGQLVKTRDKDGVETAYTYQEDGRILKSTISRASKVTQVYSYSYDDEKSQIIIEDLAGVKKIYDNNNKLLFVEKDNKIYTYYYSAGQTVLDNADVEKIKSYMSSLQSIATTNDLLEGTDLSTEFDTIEDTFRYTPPDNFAIEELTQYTDSSGNVIRFNGGTIVSITRADGIIISDIIYNGRNIIGYKITLPSNAGGSIFTIRDNYIYSEEKTDGSVTYYYSNGWVRSIKDTEGIETNYIYEVPLTLTGTSLGATNYTQIDEQSDSATLALNGDALEGTFILNPVEINAKVVRHVDWSSSSPAGCQVAIQIRTADSINETDINLSPWSAWSGEITAPQDLTNIPAGKFIQYKIILRRDVKTKNPSVDLKSVKINILSRLSDGTDESLTNAVNKDGKTYVYDGKEKLIKIIDGGTTYTYTPESKIKSIAEASGKVTAYIYDEKSPTSLTEIIINDQGQELHYDSTGRLTKVVNLSTSMQYEYYYNGDVVTVKTTYTSKQATKQDFANFAKDGVAVNDYEGTTHILLERQLPLDYGTGQDGVLTVKKGETRILEAGTYNFESVYIEEGAVLVVQSWDRSTGQGGTLIIRSEREAVIDGIIIADGAGYGQGRGPGSGTAGQQGKDVDDQNDRERGSGGGGAGHAADGKTGKANTGTSAGSGGSAYPTYEMGSGGGNGGGYNAAGGVSAPTGGSGGGLIQIIAPIVNVNGTLSANGSNGQGAPSDLAGGAGGGSGGSIILSGEQVSIVGKVTASGGYGGSGKASGGDGSAGMIKVDYGVREGDIFYGTSQIQQPSICYNQLTYVSQGTLTSNAIALNTGTVDSETAYLNANLDIPILSNVKIETRTGVSGNVSNDADWSGWQEATLDQYGYKINSALNKFIQYRLVLTTSENDKSPGAYTINDFAVKLTFTDIEHLVASDVIYEAPQTLSLVTLPILNDNPLDRVERVVTDTGAIPQDTATLTSGSLFYSYEDISAFTSQINSSILDNSEPVTTKFDIEADGGMKTEYVQKKDGSIEHYDADGKVRFITDVSGALLARYYYDVDGNLKDVRLWAERNTLNHEITSAGNEIMRSEVEDLQRLADQVNAAHTQLDQQVAEVQAELDNARAEIESYRYITYETEVSSMFGKKRVVVSVENPYYSQMIATLDLAERQFHDNTELAYFSLANMANVSQGRIEAAAQAAFSNLERQRNVCMVQILRKELTTVIYDYYIKFLGRLPSTQELNDLIEDLAVKSTLLQDTYTIDVNALKTDLESRAERASRVQEIADIMAGVEGIITDYFTSETGKTELIDMLGLSDENIVELTQSDWNTILNWLKYNQQNTMHFGQSAFLVLKGLIDDYYAIHPEAANASESSHERYVRLSVKCIVIDIITGVINPFTEGDLQLSLFALGKVAQLEGLDIRAYKLDWQDLVDRVGNYRNIAKEKVIVHMNSNHYVVVTGIDAENNITYYEPNMGEEGESVTVSKDQFMNIWKGFALSARAPPEVSKKLTSLEAQSIRGSDIFLIISIILSVISFGLSFIDNEFCQILSKVLAIVAVITAGIDILGSLKTIFDSLASGIAAFKDVFTMSFVKIGDVFANTFKSFISMVSNIGISENIINTVLSIPFTITISRGLEFMGVDPTIARLVTSFVSAGAFGGGSLFRFSMGNALEGLAIAGVQELGSVFNIDPNLTNIFAIGAGAFVGNIGKSFDSVTHVFNFTTFSDLIGHTVLPNIMSELVYYGINKLGDLLGIDSRISYLAGIGIRSMINPGIDPRTGDPQSIWDSVTRGLFQGVVNIGISYATQELGLDPLLANLGFSVIAGAINAGIQASIGPVDQNTGERPDVFKTIFETYRNNALAFFGGDPNNAWQQAAYMSQIIDFSNIVKERGLVEALNTYGASFFNASAVNSIVSAGYTIGEYFAEKLRTSQFRWETKNGKTYAVVDMPAENGKKSSGFFEWLLNDDETGYWNPIGKEDAIGAEDFWGIGKLGKDAYGNLGFWKDSEWISKFDSYWQLQRIENGQQTYTEIRDLDGNTLLVIEPTDGGHCNLYNSMGEYAKAKIINFLSNKTYSFDDATLKYYQELNASNSASLFDANFSDADMMTLIFNYFSLSSSDIANFNFTDAQKKQITYVLFHGIGNTCPDGVAPAYMTNFAQELAWADPNGATVKSVAMFPHSGFLSIDAKMEDVVNWIANAYLGSHYLTNEIITGMQSQFNGQIPSNMIGVAYSGSGDPFIQAVNANPSWDVKSIVLVDTPIACNRKITNSHVNNVIIITGMDDLLAGMGSIDKDFNNNPQPLNVYKMVLIGVGHTDFANQNSNDPTATEMARFSAYVTTLSNNSDSLNNFIIRNTEGIRYDFGLKMYVVDLSKVTYGN